MRQPVDLSADGHTRALVRSPGSYKVDEAPVDDPRNGEWCGGIMSDRQTGSWVTPPTCPWVVPRMSWIESTPSADTCSATEEWLADGSENWAALCAAHGGSRKRGTSGSAVVVRCRPIERNTLPYAREQRLARQAPTACKVARYRSRVPRASEAGCRGCFCVMASWSGTRSRVRLSKGLL